MAEPDARIACHVAGRGPGVLFLHGFPEHGAIWQPLIARLSVGVTAVIPELPGFAGSPALSSPHAADCADALAAMMRGHGFSRYAVVAHDIGGMIGWQMAIRHPFAVRALAGISAPHPADFLRLVWQDAPALRLPYLDDMTSGLAEPLDAAWLADAVFPPGAARDRLTAALSHSDAAAIRAFYAANLGPQALPYWSALPPAGCPVTLFAGRDDPFIPAAAYGPITRAAGPIHTLPGGHFLPVAATLPLARHLDDWLLALHGEHDDG